MTVKIPKSQVGTDFDTLVAHHAHEMREWRTHMGRVAEDEKNKVTGIKKHWAHPRPGAHPLVESAVNEKGEVDYEIFDDGPSPSQQLDAKKSRLFAAVSFAEQAAIAKVVPPAKVRLFMLMENEILEKQKIEPGGLIERAGEFLGFSRHVQSDDEKAFMQAQQDRRARIAIIERTGAQAHSDIEDLTAETIDAWQVPDFSKL